MQRILMASILASAFVAPSFASAKCYSFRDTDVRVCVGEDGRDSGSDRRQATAVCEDVTDSSCRITGYSTSCRESGGTQCYDTSGSRHRSLDGY